MGLEQYFPPGTDEDTIQEAISKYYYSCTEVTPTCPVENTALGYFPNKGINVFFAIGYFLAMVTALVLGIRTKTWSYTGFLAAGCALEAAGYAARVPLSINPWNKHAFETQIIAIILGPTLVCVSIYLTLKHVCLALNPALSRVRPQRYPFIFVPLDLSCLLIQAIGGALAASGALTNMRVVQHGNRCIISGIVLQMLVLGFFGTVAGEYFVRTAKWIQSGQADAEVVELWKNKKFRMFTYAVGGAYSGILIRCIYRTIEMAGGWGNHIMQDEPSFIVLEGFMVLIPFILLAIFSPGYFFPQMAARMSARKGRGTSDSEKHAGSPPAESEKPGGHHNTTTSGDETSPASETLVVEPASVKTEA
ncbi:hypothetical protein VTJ83DRAFT_4566 [Remersonia thermophila]|uniref:Uncharacterized protein n=1 Tax=Remersonia thermophila TaxID=72144 RepID=A0ABR4DB79_9PEZI